MDNQNSPGSGYAELEKELLILKKQNEFLEEENRRLARENTRLSSAVSQAALAVEKLKGSKAARISKLFHILRHPEKFGASNAATLLWKKFIRKQPLGSSYHIAHEIAAALSSHQSEEKRFFPQFDRSKDFAGRVYIFAAVPCDDIGGGQRSAQIARALLERMYQVYYICQYPKIENHTEQSAEFSSAQFTHHLLKNCDIGELFCDAPENSRIIFEMPHPDFVPVLEEARKRGFHTTYELIDPWDTELGSGWYSPETEQLFIDRCTVVCATAKVLQKHLFSMGRTDALYLPNAADETRFSADKQYPKPADFPEKFRRVITYFGSLYGSWFDWKTVKYAAENNPEHAFLLIGDVPKHAPAMPENVIFAGVKENSSLAGYLAWSDAAMIPFTPGKLTDAVSPVKVFEYIFAGKPVITLAMPETADYPGVYQAVSREEFSKLCSLCHVCAPKPNERELFISRNSWNCRVDTVLEPHKLEHSYSIITLIHNNAGIIGRFLDTLLFHTRNFKNVEIIVVDNSSSDGGAEIVEKSYPQVKLVRNSENGCASGRNLGVASSTGERLIFFDSDQYFSSSAWLTDCELLCDLNLETGAFAWGAGWFVSESRGGPSVDDLPLRAVNTQEYRSNGFRTDIHYLATCGLCMERKLFDDIGGFDTAYDPTIFEDTDLSMKILAHGRKIAYRNFPGVMHQPHQTTGAGDNSAAYRKLWQRNSAYFVNKWKELLEKMLNRG